MGATVSVIIRNRNEGKYLSSVLQALSAQDVPATDVVLVDNESSDDSVKRALAFGAKVLTISKQAFSYGRALNLGMREASGSICVLLSAHSMPIGPSFLSECLKPFSDPRVAATRCLHAGKRFDLERWWKPEVIQDPTGIDVIVSKGPLASGCAIRRSVWAEIPFDEEVTAAEEKIWALDVLRKGYSIVSPCSALYSYMKTTSSREAVIKNRREAVAIYQRTGRKLAFVNRSFPGALFDFATAVLVDAPIAGVRVITRSALVNYCRVLFPFQAARKQKTGSLY
jgi:glycosyltransferase involved in cell wall biosynthesis